MNKHLQLALRVIAFTPLILYTIAAIIDWEPTKMQKFAGLMWTFVGFIFGWFLPAMIADIYKSK